ncbi:hypothetical protein BXZ70DRAFT_941698 [Cristinia sonorae]|uniref:Uncharacterized protein n=1 Tax=Cristinia sonorae TaxID=1940300 RepID=A0A8K0XPA4_9AGAR|nr:hypothetical protein BXZ70DRAFT_941698 [Cristinia sonorae]
MPRHEVEVYERDSSHIFHIDHDGKVGNFKLMIDATVHPDKVPQASRVSLFSDDVTPSEFSDDSTDLDSICSPGTKLVALIDSMETPDDKAKKMQLMGQLVQRHKKALENQASLFEGKASDQMQRFTDKLMLIEEQKKQIAKKDRELVELKDEKLASSRALEAMMSDFCKRLDNIEADLKVTKSKLAATEDKLETMMAKLAATDDKLETMDRDFRLFQQKHERCDRAYGGFQATDGGDILTSPVCARQ